MGTTYPPDGYTVGSGTWGTDIDYVVDEDCQSGDGYVQFADTTPAADPFLYTEWVPTSAGSPLLIESVLAADSKAAGNTVFVKVEWGDFEFDGMGSNTVFDGLVTTVDTWERKSAVLTAPATARYFRLWFGKNNTAFNAWFDSVNVTDAPKGFKATLSANQTLTGGGGKIHFDSESFDFGGVFDSTTNHTMTVQEPGLWVFTWNVFLLDVDSFIVSPVKNGSTQLAYTIIPDSSEVWQAGGTHVEFLQAGDTIELQVTAGSLLTFDINDADTYLSGYCIK
jgi:hypothetical protein